MLEFDGKHIDTDAHGYLKNINDWSEAWSLFLLKKKALP